MAKLDLNDILDKFYKLDEELVKARTDLAKTEMEYSEKWDRLILGDEASGLGTQALREAMVRGILRETGLEYTKAEKELKVKILQTRWYTYKQMISALISLNYEKDY